MAKGKSFLLWLTTYFLLYTLIPSVIFVHNVLLSYLFGSILSAHNSNSPHKEEGIKVYRTVVLMKVFYDFICLKKVTLRN